MSPCCRYSRAGTRCLGREAGRDFGAEAQPAKAANSRLGETAAWRTRSIDRGCRPVPVGSRLLWTPGIRGRLAMERNGPSAPDVFVIVARPTTAPILSRAASPEHAIERACAFWHSPGCRPKPWGWTVGPGRSNSRSAGQAQDSVARAWRQLRVAKRSTGGQHDQQGSAQLPSAKAAPTLVCGSTRPWLSWPWHACELAKVGPMSAGHGLGRRHARTAQLDYGGRLGRSA